MDQRVVMERLVRREDADRDQVAVEPVRVDVMNAVSGLEAWDARRNP
jgi:hypothetical protein